MTKLFAVMVVILHALALATIGIGDFHTSHARPGRQWSPAPRLGCPVRCFPRVIGKVEEMQIIQVISDRQPG
jgi:hypothetical protein